MSFASCVPNGAALTLLYNWTFSTAHMNGVTVTGVRNVMTSKPKVSAWFLQ